MRTYAKNFQSHPSTVKRPTFKEYASREATEWDLRVDISDDLPLDKVVANVVGHGSKIEFVLVGGIEMPDQGARLAPADGFKTVSASTSTELHSHIALITTVPVNRLTALAMVRGPRKLGDEYAVPRNQRFTYAGWVAHHAKSQWKVDPDAPTIAYEDGDLPEDPFDEATCWNVVKMVKKFNSPGMRDRFIAYSDKLTELKAAKLANVPPVTDFAAGYCIVPQSQS